MTRLRRRSRTFAAACFLIVASMPHAVVGESQPFAAKADEQAIEGVLAEFVSAWNRHDAKAFSMVFAEDADFTNVSGVTARGRVQVESFHAPRFATHFKDSRQRITNTKIRFIKPDVAAVDAQWEMTGAKNKEGHDIPFRQGLLAFVMVKQGDKWLIAVMHNMDLSDKKK